MVTVLQSALLPGSPHEAFPLARGRGEGQEFWQGIAECRAGRFRRDDATAGRGETWKPIPLRAKPYRKRPHALPGSTWGREEWLSERYFFFAARFSSMAACAAARRATGTRYGEQLT